MSKPELKKEPTRDPMEAATAEVLALAGVRYHREHRESGLDFYLPDFDVYIEVKQFHSDRIAAQMSRRRNVIAIQGLGSLDALKKLLLKG